MQFYWTQTAALLAVAGLLGACGGDGTPTAETPIVAPATSTVKYSGRVSEANGSPLGQISVTLENRRTDEQIQLVTAADGRFEATVEKGVYDVIFDDRDATNYVSQQLLHVDLQAADVKQDVQLRSTAGLPHNLLSASVRDESGQPAAERKLLILPVIARAGEGKDAAVPDPFVVQTDAQGQFTHVLGEEGQDFDIDVLVLSRNAPEPDLSPLAASQVFAEEQDSAARQPFANYLSLYVEESVDVEKPHGAIDLQVVIGSSKRNLRSASGAASVVRADAQQLALQEESDSSAGAAPPPPAALPARFNIQELSYGNDILKRATLGGAKIGIDGHCGHHSLQSLADWSAHPNWDKYVDNTVLDGVSICSARLGRDWRTLGVTWRHVVGVKSSKAGTFHFTDATNHTYALHIHRPTDEEHFVKITTLGQPTSIIKVGFELP